MIQRCGRSRAYALHILNLILHILHIEQIFLFKLKERWET